MKNQKLEKGLDIQRNKVYTFEGENYLAIPAFYGCYNCTFAIENEHTDYNKGAVGCLVGDVNCHCAGNSVIFLYEHDIHELKNFLRMNAARKANFLAKIDKAYSCYINNDSFIKSLYLSFLKGWISKKQGYYLSVFFVKHGYTLDKIKEIKL